MVVVGATGKTGRAVARGPRSPAGSAVRAAVRTGPRAALPLPARHAGGRRPGDRGTAWSRPSTAREPSTTWLPTCTPTRSGIAAPGRAAAAAAAGLPRLVFHSVLHPDDAPDAAPPAQGRGGGACCARPSASGSPCCGPRPTTRTSSAQARAGMLTVPYSLDAPFTNVDLDDVARGRGGRPASAPSTRADPRPRRPGGAHHPADDRGGGGRPGPPGERARGSRLARVAGRPGRRTLERRRPATTSPPMFAGLRRGRPGGRLRGALRARSDGRRRRGRPACHGVRPTGPDRSQHCAARGRRDRRKSPGTKSWVGSGAVDQAIREPGARRRAARSARTAATGSPRRYRRNRADHDRAGVPYRARWRAGRHREAHAMDVSTFYALFSATCFTLTGLWWSVVEKHRHWLRDPGHAAPGRVGLPRLPAPRADGPVRADRRQREPGLLAGQLRRHRRDRLRLDGDAAAPRPGRRGRRPVRALLVGRRGRLRASWPVLGVAPEIARSIGITPLQAEATMLVLLVALAHALVWEFMTHEGHADAHLSHPRGRVGRWQVRRERGRGRPLPRADRQASTSSTATGATCSPTPRRRTPTSSRTRWDEYAAWHLGLTEGANDETKARYAFVYGDLRRVHRTGADRLRLPGRRSGGTRRSSSPPTTCSSTSSVSGHA